MSLTASDAQERALQKIGDLRRLSKELCAIMGELALPGPEEFAAMRSSEVPWTPEAYIAAVIRNAEFHVDEARVVLNDYASEKAESLAAAWRERRLPAPPIERSLRYLVEERSKKKIPPSEHEELYFRPQVGREALLSIFRRLIDLWSARPRP